LDGGKMSTLRKTLLALITVLILSGTALASISYSLSSIPNPPTIYTGDSTTVSFSITNNNYLYSGNCAYNLDNGVWSSEFSVPAHSATGSIIIPVQAPQEGSGSGSVQHTVYTYCYEPAIGGDKTHITQSMSFTLSYDDSRYNARIAVNSVQGAINSAQSSINNAQNAVNDAKNLGGDTSLAESKLSNAQNSLQTAQSKLSSANSYYSSSNYNQATTTANEAKSSADSAKKRC
jgi:hypothetical protein